MAIEFACPTCGKVLKLRDEAAGKKGRCPYCKEVITVPEASLAQDDLIEIVSADAPKKPPVLPPRPPKPSVSTPAPPAAPPAGATKPCPDCGKPLGEKAVICVNCGLNLKTGKKLQTVFEQPKPEPAKPAEPPKPGEQGPAKA